MTSKGVHARRRRKKRTSTKENKIAKSEVKEATLENVTFLPIDENIFSDPLLHLDNKVTF